jgi:T5SS/PEP-CTERM-associated repeat protein
LTSDIRPPIPFSISFLKKVLSVKICAYFFHDWNQESFGMTRFLKIFTVLLVTAMGALAQYTNILDNATTQQVDSVWNAGPVYVGDSTSNNVLRIVNGGQVTASLAVIGTTQESLNNELVITGAKASWNSAGLLFVGQSGSDNYLEVSGGADVSVGALYVGREEVSSNNVAVISGEGTTLSVGADILSGARGSNNRLLIESGARVESLWGGVGYNAKASNNSIVVTGRGTSWNITNDLWVGNQGDGNTFKVQGGAAVTNNNGYVGFYVDGPSADSNAVVVSGTDSKWVNLNTLRLGAENVTSNTGNRISVYDGGTIVASNLVIKGNNNNFYLGSAGTLELENGIDVSQDGFTWGTNSHLSLAGELTGTEGSLSGSRELTLRTSNGVWQAGENLAVGGDERGSLMLTNGAAVYVGDAGDADVGAVDGGLIVAATNGMASMAITNGSSVSVFGTIYVGGTNASAQGTITVLDSSTLQTDELVINNTNSNVTVGDTATLFVTDDYNADAMGDKVVLEEGSELKVGGVLTKSDALSGNEQTLTLVDDAEWTTAVSTVVDGTNNTLNVTDGSDVSSTDGMVDGYQNTVNVSGDGSEWDNAGTLTVGGDENAVNVSSGGTVSTDLLHVEDGNEFNLKSGGNLLISSNFNWAASSNLNWESGGHVVLSGTLEGMDAIEIVSGTESNQYTYLDGGKRLTLDDSDWIAGTETNLIVGYESSDTRLYVSNGTDVVSKNTYIGWGENAYRNGMTVTGSNSTLTASGGGLYVGAYWDGTNLVSTGNGGSIGNNNTLTVSDGARVTVGDAVTNVTGVLVASADEAQLILGSGTVTIEDTLMVGVGTNASGVVEIRSGSKLSVGELVIDNGSVSNLAGGIFDYRGAVFDVADWETNGFYWADHAELSVGGKLSGMTNVLAGGKDVTLDGSDATWTVGGDLTVGAGADSSVLKIVNGGTVISGSTLIGGDTNSANNEVVLDQGGLWTVNGDITVGYDSSGNGLYIQGGSTNTVTRSVKIGNETTDNFVLLTESNSWLSVVGNVDVGSINGGTNNTLTVNQAAKMRVGTDLNVHSGNTLAMASDGEISVGGNFQVASNAVVSGSGSVVLENSSSVLDLVYGNTAVSTNISFKGQGDNRVNVSGGMFVVPWATTNQYSGFGELVMTDTELVGEGSLEAFSNVSLTGGIIRPTDNLNDDETGTIEFSGSFSASNTRYIAQVDRWTSDLLVFDGSQAVDLSGLIAEVDVYTVPGSSNMTATIISNPAGFDSTEFNTNSVVTDRLLLFDADLSYLPDRVDVVVSENGEAFSSSLALAATESVRVGFDGMKNAVLTRTKQLRRNVVATAHNVKAAPIPEEDVDAPVGAYGPGDENTIFDMHVWAQYFNGQGVYDEHGASYGFDLNHNGTTIGFDRLVGEDLTVGFNYTYSRTSAETTNTDTLDSETYWLGLYGEWVSTEGLYVDTMAAYGRSSYDSVRIEQVDNTDYRGTASYRGNALGAYMDVGQYYYYKNWSLSPYVGLHALFSNTKEHTEDNGRGDLLYVDAVDRTWIESALGLKARYRFDTGIGRFQVAGFAEWTHLEIGVGYNGRFSEHYEEHTGSLMFDVMF